jgi:hypothetical protein
VTKYTPLSSADIATAELLFERVVVPVMAREHQKPGEQPHDGAYLGIRNFLNEETVRKKAGAATENQFASYSVNIDGKNDALEQNPAHNASWEVHKGDTSKKPYPGAIRSDFDDRVAISGFSWQRDTIGSLWIPVKLNRISYWNASVIARRCGLADDFEHLFYKLARAA